jgi:hypothetical protein
MKLSSMSLLFSSILFLQSFSQVKEAVQNLKVQANKMGQAFIKADYVTFAKYTYPKLLAAMGGESKMTAEIAKVINEMKSQGMLFNSISFGEPSSIIRNGKELQCTLPQHTDIKLIDGRAVSTSTLIAISIDNGTNWTFIDTSNKDMETLRKALPNLSPTITVPPQQPPTKYSN